MKSFFLKQLSLFFTRNTMASLKYFPVLVAFFIPEHALSQAAIRGKIIDSSQGKGLVYATIGLFRQAAAKKPFRTTLSASEGFFELKGVDTGRYTLRISFVGYQEAVITPVIVATGQPVSDIGTIRLMPVVANLKKVVIAQMIQKPVIEVDEDMIIYNAENDISMEGQSGIDVMRKVPFVSVDANGNLLLKGQANFLVLVNGRRSGIFIKNPGEVLKHYPAALIKRVEVTTTPSAKYDAEGAGGIINIITQKKVVGYNIGVGAAVNTFGGYSGNASLNLKKGKVGVLANYSFGMVRVPFGGSFIETELNTSSAFFSRKLNGEGKSRSFWNSGAMEISWDVDSLNTLSLYSDLSGGNNTNRSAYVQTLLQQDNSIIAEGDLSNINRNRYPGISGGLDYIHRFRNKKGKEWSARFNYFHLRDDAWIEGITEFPSGIRFVMNDNKVKNRELTGQSDFIQPLTRNGRLDAGMKIISRHAVSDYLSYVKYSPPEDYKLNTGNSDNYDFTQNIYAAYLSLTKVWKKTTTLKIGARVEHTSLESYFASTNAVIKQSYTTLIPSIFLSRRTKRNFVLSLSYTRRLRRPYVWDLNPFVDNADSLNVSYGNPLLKVQQLHVMEIGYSKSAGKVSTILKLAGSYSNNQVARYFILDEPSGIITRTIGNIGRYFSTGVLGSVNVQFSKKWGANLNSSLYYEQIRHRIQSGISNSGIVGSVYGGSNYDISKIVSVFVNASWVRPALLIQQKQMDAPWYNFGGTWKLANNKIRLTLTATNVFKQFNRSTRRTEDPFFHSYATTFIPVRSASISFRWNFGKLSESVSRKRGVFNDDLLPKK